MLLYLDNNTYKYKIYITIFISIPYIQYTIYIVYFIKFKDNRDAPVWWSKLNY